MSKLLRLLPILALSMLCQQALAQTYGSAQGQITSPSQMSLNGVFTSASLPSAATYVGYTAYTSDLGPVYSNGTTWTSIGGIAPTIANGTVLGNKSGAPGPPVAYGSLNGLMNCSNNFVNPSTFSSSNGCQWASFTISGTQTGGAHYAPFRFGITDTYDGTSNNGSGTPNSGFDHYYTVTGGTWAGPKNAVADQFTIASSPSPTDLSQLGAVTDQLTMRDNGFSMLGTPENKSGQIWVSDMNLIMQTGSNNLTLAIGLEVDNNLQGGSVRNHAGVASYASSTNAIRGDVVDAAFVAGNANDPAGNAFNWRVGQMFGSPLGYGFNSDSTLIWAAPRMNTTAYTAPVADYGEDFRYLAPVHGFSAYANSGVDLNGDVYGGNLNTAGSLNSKTATIASIAPAAGMGGLTGGAYFDAASLPTLPIASPPNSGTVATATVATMKLALISFVPGTDVGCTNGDVLTLTGGAGSQATITLTVASGAVTGASITSVGSYTGLSATPGTTGGTCSIQPAFKFGFGIATVTVTNAGTGYPAYPLPVIIPTGTGASSDPSGNIPALLIPTMASTSAPLTVTSSMVNLSPMEVATGTTFTTSAFTGCSTTNGTPSSLVGGPQGGKFTTNSNGTTCSVTLTINGATGATAAHAWACWGADVTQSTVMTQSGQGTSTTCTLRGTIANTTDVIVFTAIGN